MNQFRSFALVIALFSLCSAAGRAQVLESEASRIEDQIAQLERQREGLYNLLEEVKLQMVQRDLVAIGLPSEHYILHSAMALEYAEAFEQARWVAHIIRPDIIEGTVGRSNDFRPDPMVPTGSAVEEDYFLKTLQADSTWTFDGFGYDRGHLAPSADFRWSAKALSESYFYSNMSPQLPEFNRGRWAELEGALRGYVTGHPETQLYVVTGPVLEPGLPVIERGVHHVAIPRQFFKVALDRINHQAIGFLMPNAAKLPYPLEHYATTVDSIEQLTGMDFFNKLDDPEEAALEGRVDKGAWFSEVARGDVDPLPQPTLGRNRFNTVVGARYMGKGDKIWVCGTVVSTRVSRSGNLWINLDKQFPNAIFSVYIKKTDLVNFEPGLQKALEGRQVCFEGVVENMNGTPTINVERAGSMQRL